LFVVDWRCAGGSEEAYARSLVEREKRGEERECGEMEGACMVWRWVYSVVVEERMWMAGGGGEVFESLDVEASRPIQMKRSLACRVRAFGILMRLRKVWCGRE
jgi:hypothetical protein